MGAGVSNILQILFSLLLIGKNFLILNIASMLHHSSIGRKYTILSVLLRLTPIEINTNRG